MRRPMNSAVSSDSPQPADSKTGLAWQLAELARSDRLSLWVCPDLRSYRQLVEELAFFLADAPQLLWRFPAWEVLPYDRVSPHHGIVGERFATLGRLLATPKPTGLLITSLPAWLQRIAPPESVAAHVWQLQVGQPFDIAELKSRLAEAGMIASERVLAAGEFAARGGLFDIWPATESAPLRIDLFGDEIESIRRFDPETQRSGEELKHFTSVPVREVILDAPGRERFEAAFRARFPQLRKHPMQLAVQAGRPHPGIEALLPLAYEETARLSDYLPDQTSIFAPADIETQRQNFATQVRSQFEMVRASSEPSISPQELFAVETQVNADPLPASPTTTAPSIADHAQSRQPQHELLEQLTAMLENGWRLLLVAHGLGQQERMVESCMALTDATGKQIEEAMPTDHDLPTIGRCIGYLDSGFALPEQKLLLLTGRELLGQKLPRKRSHRTTVLHSDIFSSLAELKVGDPVVHEEHGVGRYLGLETMAEDDADEEQFSDFIKIEYAEGANVFVPVEDLARLHRYSGE